MERERFLRAEFVTLSLQAVWASSRPARDRTAGCLLHWRRRGDPRLHPAIPGSAAQAELGRRTSAHNRGGAVKGERWQMTAAALAYRVQLPVVRRSALRLPRYRGKLKHCLPSV